MQEPNPPFFIATLIARKLSGEMTDAEQSELDQWIQYSEENKKLYENVIDPASRKNRDEFLKEIDTEADWKIVNEKVFVHPSAKQIHLAWYYRVAAVVTLVIAAGAVLYLSFRPSASDQMSFIAPGSSQAIVKLHNGKTITLSEAGNQNKEFEEANGSNLFNAQGSLSYSPGESSDTELL
jgi:transmembrane sensor